MGAYYDEIEIEDMAWDAQKNVYHYPCPCGDRFEISRQQLAECEDIATCPSCSLIIRVIYDPVRVFDNMRLVITIPPCSMVFCMFSSILRMIPMKRLMKNSWMLRTLLMNIRRLLWCPLDGSVSYGEQPVFLYNYSKSEDHTHVVVGYLPPEEWWIDILLVDL